ncbi:hypothetical protein Hanom_Chr00s004278g01721411 [Helianthus anomalus]
MLHLINIAIFKSVCFCRHMNKADEFIMVNDKVLHKFFFYFLYLFIKYSLLLFYINYYSLFFLFLNHFVFL